MMSEFAQNGCLECYYDLVKGFGFRVQFSLGFMKIKGNAWNKFFSLMALGSSKKGDQLWQRSRNNIYKKTQNTKHKT